MEDKHTPGPWVVEHGESVSVRDVATDSRLCTINWLKGRHGLAGRIPDAEGEANARLIATAPDLLEACIAVSKCGNGGAKLSRAASDKVRAAINRASR
ncbi:MAG TPA: hypothetical protein VGE09_08345 [Pseudoxanthomonas sp.]